MPEWPRSPIAASMFLEEFLPDVAAEFLAGQRLPATDLTLGVRLEGDGGGEWTLAVREGGLAVVAESRDAAAVTLVQSVEDWRGALWGGRGGVFGRTAVRLLRGRTSEALRKAARQRPAGFEALAQIERLTGRVTVVLGGDGGGDWCVSVHFGPGAIPGEPTATVRVAAADAAAMERGELDPLRAFMAGRIEVTGDMALVLQLQAIVLQAAQPPP